LADDHPDTIRYIGYDVNRGKGGASVPPSHMPRGTCASSRTPSGSGCRGPHVESE
jgi:hypothetical protein